jgi:DNA-binding transcriptional LysR family regulator
VADSQASPPATRQEPITNVNLKLLQTFMLVAELKSFKAAAAETRRSQSAVSMQIKQLEQQIGLTLFKRTTRDVRLTPEGAQLLVSTQRGLQEVAFGLRQIQETAEVGRGRVLLGCSPSIGATYLPGILADFQREYPGIQVLLSEERSVDLVESIREGRIDFCLAVAINAPDLDVEPVLADQLYALVPNGMAAGYERTISLRELAKLPLLHFHAVSMMAQISENAARAHGITLNIRFRCIQAQTLVAMAEAGLGAAIMRQSLAETAHSPSTRKLLIVEPTMTEHFSLIRVKGRKLSPAAARLSELIRERMRSRNEQRAIDQVI